eukprot:4146422-Pleurochrysis_carterae.AAC.3
MGGATERRRGKGQIGMENARADGNYAGKSGELSQIGGVASRPNRNESVVVRGQGCSDSDARCLAGGSDNLSRAPRRA